MYRVSPTGKLEGVLNDYDLASWDKVPTTNSDRIVADPFAALEFLRDEDGRHIPRMYRHDAESLVWVLACLLAVTIKYENHSVKISWPPWVESWFTGDSRSHQDSKVALSYNYGRISPGPGHHAQYSAVIRGLITSWAAIDAYVQDMRKKGVVELDINDPKNGLEDFVKRVEIPSEVDPRKIFLKVKALLLEAIETTKVV